MGIQISIPSHTITLSYVSGQMNAKVVIFKAQIYRTPIPSDHYEEQNLVYVCFIVHTYTATQLVSTETIQTLVASAPLGYVRFTCGDYDYFRYSPCYRRFHMLHSLRPELSKIQCDPVSSWRLSNQPKRKLLLRLMRQDESQS